MKSCRDNFMFHNDPKSSTDISKQIQHKAEGETYFEGEVYLTRSM